MSDQLDELLGRCAPTVTGSSTQLEVELGLLTEQARLTAGREPVALVRQPCRRRRAALAAGVAVLVLGGGSVAAANSGLDGPWRWWVKEPAGRAVLTTAGHECQIRWMYEQDSDDDVDAGPAVQAAEDYLQTLNVQRFVDGLDLEAVRVDYAREHTPSMAAVGVRTTAWEETAHGVETIVSEKVVDELQQRQVPGLLGMLGTSEVHCQDAPR